MFSAEGYDVHFALVESFFKAQPKRDYLSVNIYDAHKGIRYSANMNLEMAKVKLIELQEGIKQLEELEAKDARESGTSPV